MVTSIAKPAAAASVLKILQCTNLGGMEQVAYNLMRDLHNAGDFDFHVLTPRRFGNGRPILEEIDPSCRDFSYKGKFGWRSLPAFKHAVAEAAESSESIWITGTCACSLTAVRRLDRPKVLSHHFPHFDSPSGALKWFGFYHLLCPQLQAITYPTKFTRDEALVIAPWLAPKTHVVRHGYTSYYSDETTRLKEQLDARRELGLPEDAFIVGNAGWLLSYKRFDIFLEVAQRVRERLPNACFVVCGGGPDESALKEKARTLGISDSVRFVGWVRDMKPYYKAWDVCLFNSDSDAFGRTPIEAACHGCLAVASVVYGGLSEFLIHNENGVLLDTHDVEALSHEILTLAREPTKAISFREAAAEKIRNEYNPAESADYYRCLLKE